MDEIINLTKFSSSENVFVLVILLLLLLLYLKV